MSQTDAVLERRQRTRDLATHVVRPGLPRLFVAALVVVALLTLTAVEAPTASLRILWRFAVLSFDHPSTQVLDEVACELLAPGEAGIEGRFTRAVPSGRFAPAGKLGRFVSPGLCSGITRSPPAA